MDKAILNLIGNTPLIKLDLNIPNINLLVKLEIYNLTGSIKDRMALYMLKKAQKKSLLKKGATIIEATTGNTGISFAALARIFGYKMIAIMPEGQSLERIKILRSYQAEVILTPENEGPLGAIELRDKLAQKIKDSWVPYQFENLDNVKAHEVSTAQEIMRQVKEKIDYFVHGIGTGGTLMGVAKVLKKKFPEVPVVKLVKAFQQMPQSYLLKCLHRGQ